MTLNFSSQSYLGHGTCYCRRREGGDPKRLTSQLYTDVPHRRDTGVWVPASPGTTVVLAKLAKLGIEPMIMSPAELASYIAAGIDGRRG